MSDWGLSRLRRPVANGGSGGRREGTDRSAVAGQSDAESRSEFGHELYIDSTNLVAALEDVPAVRTLEVGCGYGRLTPWIADRTDCLCALDLERSLLSAARREYPDVQFQQARTVALPFADGAFDLAVTWGVLDHFPTGSIRVAANELDRVVGSGGPTSSRSRRRTRRLASPTSKGWGSGCRRWRRPPAVPGSS